MTNPSNDSILIYTGDFSTHTPIPFVQAVKAGFPSPAQDYMTDAIDFNKDLVEHPAATFYARVRGDSMIGAGINNDDILVVDRAVEAVDGDIVLAFIDGEFTVKYLDLSNRGEGYALLVPANEKYKPIRVDASEDFKVWGVVTWIIKPRRARGFARRISNESSDK